MKYSMEVEGSLPGGEQVVVLMDDTEVWRAQLPTQGPARDGIVDSIDQRLDSLHNHIDEDTVAVTLLTPGMLRAMMDDIMAHRW